MNTPWSASIAKTARTKPPAAALPATLSMLRSAPTGRHTPAGAPLRLATIAAGGLLLVACAGNPPKEQFAVTETAVRGAVSAGGTEYAPVEMRSAQEKWQEAELAMQKEEYVRANALAEQAEWDARVAERKAQAAKARKAADDASQGIRELKEEGMRITP